MKLLPRNHRSFVLVVHLGRVTDPGYVYQLESLINQMPEGSIEVFDYAGTGATDWSISCRSSPAAEAG